MPSPTLPIPKFPPKVQRAMATYGVIRAGWSIYKLLTQPPPVLQLQETPWRPSEWSSQPRPVYLIDSLANVYVFDAIMRLGHSTAIRKTEHPVQGGANISDHAYILPERLILEIGMSDVMDNYFSEGMNGQVVEGDSQNGYAFRWADGNNKSYSTYQILKDLQYARQPLSVMTRLNNYTNMLITHIEAPDDFKTNHGLKCFISLEQIMTAQVSTSKVKTSSRPAGTAKPKPKVASPAAVPSLLNSAIKGLGFKLPWQ